MTIDGGASADQRRPVTEVEVSVTDDRYPFVAATDGRDAVVELAEILPREDARYAEFFTVEGLDPERVIDLVADHDSAEATFLDAYGDTALFEFRVYDNCPVVALAERGALPREVTAVDGEGRIVAEVPPRYDTGAVVGPFLENHPDTALVAKREKASFSPLLTESAFEDVTRTRLTDRQWDVLRAAYEAGYYQWPRDCTGTEVADKLEITSATFSEHIHAAERKLLCLLFEGT